MAAADESLVVTGPGEHDPLGLHISPSQPQALLRGPGPLIVPGGVCLMQYNEPRSTPWWPGGDFGVVAFSVLLPPPCIHSVLLTWHTSIPNLFCVDELRTVSGTVRLQMMEKTLQIQTRRLYDPRCYPLSFFPMSWTQTATV